MTSIGRRRVYTDDLPDGTDAVAVREGGVIVVRMRVSVPEGERAEAEKAAVLALREQERSGGLGVIIPGAALVRLLPRWHHAAGVAGMVLATAAGAVIVIPGGGGGIISEHPAPRPAASSGRQGPLPAAHPPRRSAPARVTVPAAPGDTPAPSPSPAVSVSASAGVADGAAGRDARADIDLTGPRQRAHDISVHLRRAIPPLPVPLPEAGVSGCVSVRRIVRAGDLVRACGHIDVLPSPDIGPGTSQSP